MSAKHKDYSLGSARAEMRYIFGKYSDLIFRREPDQMQSFGPAGRPENGNSATKTPEMVQGCEPLWVMVQPGEPQKTAKN